MKIIEETMLTTIDNPFNPFTQYDKWLAFDEGKGYYTNEYLARIVVTSHELSESDQILAINSAIDEILEMDPLGIYIKVTKDIKTKGDTVSNS